MTPCVHLYFYLPSLEKPQSQFTPFPLHLKSTSLHLKSTSHLEEKVRSVPIFSTHLFIYFCKMIKKSKSYTRAYAKIFTILKLFA